MFDAYNFIILTFILIIVLFNMKAEKTVLKLFYHYILFLSFLEGCYGFW